MSEHGKIEELTDSLKRYATTSYELIKLEASERTSVIGSGVMSSLVLGVVGIMFAFFLSFAAGFYISARMGDSWSGFAMVAGFYLVLLLILAVGRKSLVEKPMRDKIIRNIFSKN
jgi:hypothetical protein